LKPQVRGSVRTVSRDLSQLHRQGLLERLGSSVPFEAIGERVYRLDQLDQALADAESMRITKAVVDPGAATSDREMGQRI